MRKGRAFDAADVAASRGADAGPSSARDRDPDNSRRAFLRDFRRLVEMCDVVIEVLDARDPLGCR